MGTFLAFLGSLISAEVKKIAPTVVKDSEQFVSTAVKDVREVFSVGVPFAVKFVKAEASKVISGREKFSNAVVNTIQAVEAKLGPVVVADIQALVQLTYRDMQEVLGKL